MNESPSAAPVPDGPPAVWLETFGCQMNVLDSELVLGRLLKEGYVAAASRAEADVILFNTCSVRDHAEQRLNSRVGALQALKRRRPGLVIGILGCQAQREGKALLERLPHVDLVVGTRQYTRLPELLRQARKDRRARVATAMTGGLLDPDHTPLGRAHPFQAYIKVTEGCNCGCTFCVVPGTRGGEFSRPPAEIAEEAARLAGSGVVEVTLLGQNVTSYGNDLRPRVPLAELLRRVHETPGLARLKFVTGHPAFVTTPLLEAVRDLPKVCPYLHFPAQSGSDRILKAMRRGYTAARYRAICEEARILIPGVEVASDFITGFPGETEEDHAATAQLMRDVRFGTAYVFKYSPRPGTAAHRLPDDVPDDVKKRRHAELLALQNRVQLEANRALAGATVEILVEGRAARPLKTPGRSAADDVPTWTSRTRTNRIAVFRAGRDLSGREVRLRVREATALTLIGELV
jgi:tRNA-2-methylthio-N6-dimethylallyladenosine synthase